MLPFPIEPLKDDFQTSITLSRQALDKDINIAYQHYMLQFAIAVEGLAVIKTLEGIDGKEYEQLNELLKALEPDSDNDSPEKMRAYMKVAQALTLYVVESEKEKKALATENVT